MNKYCEKRELSMFDVSPIGQKFNESVPSVYTAPNYRRLEFLFKFNGNAAVSCNIAQKTA
jgi:hypothetical protein